MSEKITIGPAVYKHRRALGWSLQKLCDTAHNAVGNGYLSDIEKEVSTPGVDKAYAIAKALGTTIDQLIAESRGQYASTAKADLGSLVPVVPWDSAWEWSQNRDATQLPTGTKYFPSTNPDVAGGFYLRVLDDSMHAPAGPAFPAGSLIFVAPHVQAMPNDFVVGYQVDPRRPTFKRLATDGERRYLRALNPQIPATELDNGFTVIGVVINMMMPVPRGVVG